MNFLFGGPARQKIWRRASSEARGDANFLSKGRFLQKKLQGIRDPVSDIGDRFCGHPVGKKFQEIPKNCTKFASWQTVVPIFTYMNFLFGGPARQELRVAPLRKLAAT